MAPLTTGSLRQSTHQRFTVTDTADVGAVRRAVAGLAQRLHPGTEFAARAGQAATELAGNLVRHAEPGGWILARPLPPAALELLAVDRGPGIRDVAAAVEGRVPAPAGLGCGLAAVRRAATRFDIHSQPGAGTVVLAVLEPEHHDGAPWPAPPRPWAGVSIGIEEPCGDAWGVSTVDDGLVIVVSDGLGHGPHASLASDVALDCLARLPDDLEGYLTKANTALRETRGTVLAVCRLYPERHQLECLSVGNITGRIYHGSQQQSLVPFNGTLGMHATPPRVKVMQYPWPPGATLVLWSDGLTSRADLRDGTDLLRHDPAVVAAAAHRDHTRNRDDATVVVAHHLVT